MKTNRNTLLTLAAVFAVLTLVLLVTFTTGVLTGSVRLLSFLLPVMAMGDCLLWVDAL